MVFLARFSRVFDTPVESSVCNGFHGVRGCPICVAGRCAVGLSLAAQHGGLAPEGSGRLAGAVVV